MSLILKDNWKEGLAGWGNGYTFIEAYSEEKEIQQGKNFYVTIFPLMSQLGSLGDLVMRINNIIPHSFKNFVNLVCNTISILAVPPLLIAAMIRQGDYQKLVEKNHQRNPFFQLPNQLNGKIISICNFIAEHTGDMIRIAMIAGSVALIALGNVAYSCTLLTAIAYEAINQKGFLPRRVSLFIEIYMPAVSFIGNLIGGSSTFLRVISAISLSAHILPRFSVYIHQKVDSFIRKYFSIQEPSLQEIDAPLVKRENMGFEEIKKILESDFSQYKINYAHSSKLLNDFSQWPTDKAFEKFLHLFDSIDWPSKYNLIENKLKTDDNFLDFLKKKHPENHDFYENIDIYIEQEAQKENKTKTQYAVDLARKQLQVFVNTLLEKQPVSGKQQDLEEAIEIYEILLPYLSSLDNPVDKEDILLSLAIDAGTYCARGLKLTANYLLSSILQKNGEQKSDTDLIQDYERKVYQKLQDTRSAIIESTYTAFVEKLKIPNTVSNDVHGFDTYRLYFSLGFFPLTKFERNRLGLSQVLVWEMYHKMRSAMYNEYQDQLNDVIHKLGEVDFSIYLFNMIKNNPHLSEEQRKIIYAIFLDQNNQQWKIEQTQKQFHLFLLVRLGILIPKTENEIFKKENEIVKIGNQKETILKEVEEYFKASETSEEEDNISEEENDNIYA
jgi:hypothetical protein